MYYFNKKNYSYAKGSSGKYRTSLFRWEVESKITGIINGSRKKILEQTGAKTLYHKWISQSHFGFVISDYEIPEDTHWRSIIGSGHNQLFEIIEKEYYCLVLSKHLPSNTKEIQYDDDKKILILNIDYFQKFSKVITKKNFVNLFLYRFENKEVESVIRTWLIERPQKFQLILDTYNITVPDVATVLQNFKPKTLDGLTDYLRNSTAILKSKIAENYLLYQERLNHFEELINEEKEILENDESKYHTLENKIRDYIRINPWLIDFTFNDQDVKTNIHPFVDVLLVGSYLEYKKGLLIELKRPDTETIKQYRGRDAIKAGISDAISQLIHYTSEIQRKTIQEAKEEDPDLFLEGIIIIGKYMRQFLPTINQYLHNVKVKTYEEIYIDAKRRLENFKEGPQLTIEEQLLENGIIARPIGITDYTIKQVTEYSKLELQALYKKLGSTEGSKIAMPLEEEPDLEKRGVKLIEIYSVGIFQIICIEFGLCDKLKNIEKYDLISMASLIATIIPASQGTGIPIWIPVSLFSTIIAKSSLKKFCNCD